MTYLPQPARLWWQLLIPLGFLIAVTWIFRTTTADIDMIHSLRATFGLKSWEDANVGVWSHVKNYGVIPAFLLAIMAVMGVAIGMTHRKFSQWTRPSFYVIAVFLLGSGLITNVLLKDQWGRPRPKQVIALGGTEPFLKVLEPNFGKAGKSFPSGHATTGYVFFSLGLLLWRSRRRLAIGLLISASILGTLVGLARVLQGGHFPSDVVWAAAIMWFTSLGLLYAFRLQNFTERVAVELPENSRRPKWLAPAIIAGLAVIIGSGLVSIPRSQSAVVLFEKADYGNPSVFEFDFDGILQVVASEKAGLEIDFEGVGSPRSSVSIKLSQTSAGLMGKERRSGILTERNLSGKLRLRPGHYRVKISPAVRTVKLGEPFQNIDRSNPRELTFDLP